ncbi:MAG TPA: zinc/iron permease, partial [Clostridiaceae bacterium]|nr:zinc/iron permease [Clostridiaceae bacterium]
ALTTPIGAFFAYPFISRMDNSVLGLALGFVVGVLIYLSASHLLPEVKEHGKKHAYWAFLIGILLGIVIFLSKK